MICVKVFIQNKETMNMASIEIGMDSLAINLQLGLSKKYCIFLLPLIINILIRPKVCFDSVSVLFMEA